MTSILMAKLLRAFAACSGQQVELDIVLGFREALLRLDSAQELQEVCEVLGVDLPRPSESGHIDMWCVPRGDR